MRCPYCNGLDDRVVDSRSAEEGSAIRRRRECLECGQRYTSYERVEHVQLGVRKRDGTLETFEQAKLRVGIGRALAGREDGHFIDGLVDEISDALHGLGTTVDTERIGSLVLERLKEIDDVAYMRFASVYKEFDNLGDFESEMAALKEPTDP